MFSVQMATIHPSQELRVLCEQQGIPLICPNSSWENPEGALSIILDTGRDTSSRSWGECQGLEQAISSAEAVHIVSGDGSLSLLDHIPHGAKVHLHLLEPHRGLYEDILHREVDGSPKRSLWLTRLLLSRARRRDRSLIKSGLNRKRFRISGNSTFSARRASEVYGIDAEVLWPCVDASEFPSDASQDPENPFSGSEGDYVVCIGRASWAKGTWETISMLQGTGLSLVHVGGGDDASLAMISAHADSVGVGLWIAPRLPSNQLVKLMRDSRAVVSMAHRESFGLTPIEAFAVGTPALFVDEGGFRDTLVDGVNGRLLPRGDIAAWHSALKQAADGATRAAWAEAGRARIAEMNLSPEAQCRRLESILHSL
ncbi:MAG: glycosyltransferase family 4 protein [Candidatus Thermoplasmatota archaeon]|nr:glycosyltransferase family 4 protein [Candidatus Thermoplasmatota archaeon]